MSGDRPVRLSGISMMVGLAGWIIAGYGTMAVIGQLRLGRFAGGPALGTLVVVSIGLALALIRYHVVLDPQRRSRVKTAGWGPWVRRTEEPLGEITSIDIAPPEERGQGSGTYTAIPIEAVGPGRRDELAAARTAVRARALAQRIASALDLPIGSGSSGTRCQLQAEDLDRPLVEVEQATTRDLRPPPGTRIGIIEVGSGLEIHLPGNWIAVATVLLALAGPPLFMFGFIPPHVRGSSSVPLLVVVAACLAILWLSYRAGCFSRVIRIDPVDGLRAVGRHVDPQRLLALEVFSGRLKVITSASEFILAWGSQAEMHWLRAVILHRLGGGR